MLLERENQDTHAHLVRNLNDDSEILTATEQEYFKNRTFFSYLR